MKAIDKIISQKVQLKKLTPHPRNYNMHDSAQIGDLQKSLRRFGQVRSIVVQTRPAGGYWIVVGHGLTEAARLEKIRKPARGKAPASNDSRVIFRTAGT